MADTTFSHKRGLYTAPFTLTVTTATTGASLRYTLDGSLPSAVNGTIVAPPNATSPPVLTLAVNSTRVVRIMAFKTNVEPTNTDTNSFLFLDSVVQQADSPAAVGWPSDPLLKGSPAVAVPGKYERNGQEFDYGMDPEIVNSPNAGIGGIPQVKAALQAIPSVCVTVPVDSLTDAATGNLHQCPERRFPMGEGGQHRDAQRSGHGGPRFKANCGLRIRGGYSRTPDNPKHAFRILFRSKYGAGKLEYPIFKDDPKAATVFNKSDIHTSQNYSWAFGGDVSNTFLRELWCRVQRRLYQRPGL